MCHARVSRALQMASASSGTSAGAKRDKAMALLGELVRSSRAVVSTQVLQEFFVIAC